MQWEEGLGHSCIFAKAGSKMTTNLSPRFHEVAHWSVWNIRLPVDKLPLRTYYASSTVLGLVPRVASQHYQLSVILHRRNPGPKEWNDWPKVVQPKGGKAGLCAPAGCPSQKQRNGMRKRQHLLSKSSPGTSTEVGWDGSNPLTYTPLVGLCDGSAPRQTLWVCLSTPTLWPCNSNLRCLPKSYESTCPHKDLYTSGSFVRNCQKLENNPNVHLQVNG